jgi:hypothetical protein
MVGDQTLAQVSDLTNQQWEMAASFVSGEVDSFLHDSINGEGVISSAGASSAQTSGMPARSAISKVRQHPYARMGDPGRDRNTHPEEHPDPLNCPRNGRPLAAPVAWREQAKSVQSNNITAHALLGALATSHVDATSPSLNVREWVDNIASYLQNPLYVNLGGGSIGDTIKRCRSTFQQETGSNFVSMLTYMQLAIQCQRYASFPQALAFAGIDA